MSQAEAFPVIQGEVPEALIQVPSESFTFIPDIEPETIQFTLRGEEFIKISPSGFWFQGELVKDNRHQRLYDAMCAFFFEMSKDDVAGHRKDGAYFERDAILGFGNEYIRLKERKGEGVAAQHVAEFLANIEKNAHVAGLRKKKKE